MAPAVPVVTHSVTRCHVPTGSVRVVVKVVPGTSARTDSRSAVVTKTRPIETLAAVRSLSRAVVPDGWRAPIRTCADRHTRGCVDGSVCCAYATWLVGDTRALGTLPVGAASVWSRVTFV